MSKQKLFCFGFGQVAESFINKLIDEKISLNISKPRKNFEWKDIFYSENNNLENLKYRDLSRKKCLKI